MCDVFLVLAQAPGGPVGCFFLPRVLPDGTRNRMFLQRLKDKLGNQANASSEVEYDGAIAWLVGEEGRGVPTIIEMVNMTRLDCTLGSATSMRTRPEPWRPPRAAPPGVRPYLIDQPLMRNVLADLAVESEAATMLAMRLAGAIDAAVRGDEREAPAAPDRPRRGQVLGLQARPPRMRPRRWSASAATATSRTSGMPRLYREAPLMGIWEGSGNVTALDTLRAMATRPERIDVLFDELRRTTGQDPRLDRPRRRAAHGSDDLETISIGRRQVAEDISLALQGSLLVRSRPPGRGRGLPGQQARRPVGMGPSARCPIGLDLTPIIERALVKG